MLGDCYTAAIVEELSRKELMALDAAILYQVIHKFFNSPKEHPQYPVPYQPFDTRKKTRLSIYFLMISNEQKINRNFSKSNKISVTH